MRFCQVREIDEALARAAGELLARVGGNATIDALVVVTAARYGEIVLTGDTDDLTPLAEPLGVSVVGL